MTEFETAIRNLTDSQLDEVYRFLLAELGTANIPSSVPSLRQGES